MRRFKDVVGQKSIVDHLQNAVTTGKVSHAYILQGERSAGKEFIAKTFATALLCEKGGAEPCGECHSCKQAENDNNPDIIRIIHEKPNTIGVEDIRKLTGDIAVKPYAGKYKVYIVNEAEKMTVQAQNALLKTLEEPPEYAVILLLATNTDALLPTVLSRCVLLTMKSVSDEEVKKYLMTELMVPEYKADVCVAFARGISARQRDLLRVKNSKT